jgi:hypothetical protein
MSAGAIETGENHIKQGRASCDFGNEIEQRPARSIHGQAGLQKGT